MRAHTRRSLSLLIIHHHPSLYKQQQQMLFYEGSVSAPLRLLLGEILINFFEKLA